MTLLEGSVADRPPPSWHRKTSVSRTTSSDMPGLHKTGAELGDLPLGQYGLFENFPPQNGDQGAGHVIAGRHHDGYGIQAISTKLAESRIGRAQPSAKVGQHGSADRPTVQEAQSIQPPLSSASSGAQPLRNLHRRHASWGGFSTSGKSHHRSKSGDGAPYEELTDECASPPIAALRMFRPAEGMGDGGAKEAGDIKGNVHGPSQEASLISWEELEAKKDIYRAVATPDGRQALIKSKCAGTDESFEVVLVTGPAAPAATPSVVVPLIPPPPEILAVDHTRSTRATIPAPSAAAWPPSSSLHGASTQAAGARGGVLGPALSSLPAPRKGINTSKPSSPNLSPPSDRSSALPQGLLHPGPLLSPRRAPPPPPIPVAAGGRPVQMPDPRRSGQQLAATAKDPFGESAVW